MPLINIFLTFKLTVWMLHYRQLAWSIFHERIILDKGLMWNNLINLFFYSHKAILRGRYVNCSSGSLTNFYVSNTFLNGYLSCKFIDFSWKTQTSFSWIRGIKSILLNCSHILVSSFYLPIILFYSKWTSAALHYEKMKN